MKISRFMVCIYIHTYNNSYYKVYYAYLQVFLLLHNLCVMIMLVSVYQLEI